jgi:hypothetical protein
MDMMHNTNFLSLVAALVMATAGCADRRDVPSAGAAAVAEEAGAAAVAVAARPVFVGEIPLTLHRLADGAGTVRVSSGVLLLPGQLFAEGVGRVAVEVGGAEVSAHVAALEGRHPDGSVVSVLVQFDADPARQMSAALRLGTVPARPRLAVQPVDFRHGASFESAQHRGFPAAIVAPPVEHMVQAFRVFGPAVSVADARAMGGSHARYEDAFEEWSRRKWDAWQGWLLAGSPRDRILGSNYYDRGYHHFAWFARSGDPEYLRRGSAYTFNYRRHYYEHHDYAIAQERLWLSEGLAAHYWLTGDAESREAVRQLARRAYGGGRSWNWTRMRPCNYKGEGRPVARALSAMTWAYRLGLDDEDWRAATLGYVDLIAAGGTNGDLWGEDPDHYRYGAWVYRHPDFPRGQGCSLEYVSNFMLAMIADALITVHDHVEPDPRIPVLVGRALDYLWKTQWRGSEGNGLQQRNNERSPSFNYYDVALAGSGGPSATVDLNGFYVHVFAWYARQSAEEIYDRIADQAFHTLAAGRHDGRTSPWLQGDKQFNETFQKAWQLAGYRAAVP